MRARVQMASDWRDRGCASRWIGVWIETGPEAEGRVFLLTWLVGRFRLYLTPVGSSRWQHSLLHLYAFLAMLECYMEEEVPVTKPPTPSFGCTLVSRWNSRGHEEEAEQRRHCQRASTIRVEPRRNLDKVSRGG